MLFLLCFLINPMELMSTDFTFFGNDSGSVKKSISASEQEKNVTSPVYNRINHVCAMDLCLCKPPGFVNFCAWENQIGRLLISLLIFIQFLEYSSTWANHVLSQISQNFRILFVIE